ncbi:MAG: PHP domain-containing protein [Bacteroidia bacterium]|nr:PHP domain-containing protein [Bacteroidia bacterium]MDW8134797.1 PHP domain-containing protein [Bacteroidia bacterium]
MSKKAQAVALLTELIKRLELVEEKDFRVRAYERLLQIIESLPTHAWENEQLFLTNVTQYRGVGKGLLDTVRHLYAGETPPLLSTLREEVPDSLLELYRLPRLGPKRIRQLWKEAGVISVDGLAQALERGKIQALAGWGDTLIKQVKESIAFYRNQRNSLLYREARKVWEDAMSLLREAELFPVPIGAFRRAHPLLSPPLRGVLPASQAPAIQRLGHGISSTGIVQITPLVEIEFWEDSTFGEKLALYDFHENGNSAAYELLQKLVHESGKYKPGISEEDFFYLAGLPYILPAWRDWGDVVLLAREGKIPPLIEAKNFQGTVHVHTTYSDGRHSLKEMAESARRRGWKWLGIADHSQRAHYARGLPPEKLYEQIQEIEKLNANYAGEFYLLKGIEADILPDGRLDYDEEVWKRLDFIVASIHEKLSMTKEEATNRILKAIENPYVKVLGHWTGRLLRNRPGYPIEEEKILEACAEKGVAIEFNANPYRMEIDWYWIRKASEMGVNIILTTDAHSIEELDYWIDGLEVLQKGMLNPNLLLNFSQEPPFALKR